MGLPWLSVAVIITSLLFAPALSVSLFNILCGAVNPYILLVDCVIVWKWPFIWNFTKLSGLASVMVAEITIFSLLVKSPVGSVFVIMGDVVSTTVNVSVIFLKLSRRSFAE